MRITTNDSDATIRRYATVDNGPVIPQSYSTSGKMLRVERITIEYRLVGGSWLVEHGNNITLAGTVLKKDGTDSKVNHAGPPNYRAWRNRDEELPWLAEIVNRLRPYGVSTTFHGEFEI